MKPSGAFRLLTILMLVVFAFTLGGCETQTTGTSAGNTQTTSTGTGSTSNSSSSTSPATTANTAGTGITTATSSQSRNLTDLDGELVQTDATTATSPAATRTQAQKGTVQVNSSLNVRTGPWGSIIGSLYNGNQVDIIGKSGDWYKINFKGKTAYIHSDYVKIGGSTSSETTANTDNDASSSTNSGANGFGGPPCSPLPNRTSSEYGPRNLYGRSYHHGIDLPIPTGTSLKSIGAGTVVDVGYQAAGGNFVVIKYPNGYQASYCHLQKATVKAGQKVSQGQEIGKSDNTGQSTGAHLHLGIKKNGVWVNPRTVPGLKLPPKR
jgi:murein DD-endopeptidase MepM/ murein hydrolase activator NlpD